MNVEAFRRTIRRRVRVMTALTALYVAMMLAVHMLGKGPSGFAADFLLGVSAALVFCCALMLPRYMQALKDENALRRLWNKEHDERMQAIKAKAGVPMLLYTSAAMIAAGVLISGWNMTVSITLLLAATAQLVVSVIVKFISLRTM